MRILIADDESIIRLGLKSLLQELGHKVIMARDGREALSLARQQRPDLAILDIKMPYTDGLQAAHTLAHTQPLPILILTAFNERDLIEKATDLPIHGYLIKPLKPGELEAALSVAVKRFEEAQSLQTHTNKLEERLQTRKVLDRAKGQLMAQGLTEEAAYRQLQRLARESQRTMREVAEGILKK